MIHIAGNGQPKKPGDLPRAPPGFLEETRGSTQDIPGFEETRGFSQGVPGFPPGNPGIYPGHPRVSWRDMDRMEGNGQG